MVKSSIYFELIFVSGVRYGSSFIPLHVVVHFSQHHFLKRLSSPRAELSAPLSNISGLRARGLIWVPRSVPLVRVPTFMPQPRRLVTIGL